MKKILQGKVGVIIDNPPGGVIKKVPVTNVLERKVLNHLRGLPNIIELLNVEESPDKGFLLMEFERYDGNLTQFKTELVLNPGLISEFMLQIINGVYCIHAMHIVHRDLHPSNILVKLQNQHIVIADFGSACNVPPKGKHCITPCMTPPARFRAPEVFQDWYNEKMDIWAIGCIYYGMVTGYYLFPDETTIHDAHEKFDVGHYKQWMKKVYPKWARLMEKDPKRRINALDALKLFNG